MRLVGIPESEIAETLRLFERENDLSGIELTTCMREGELEVSASFDPGDEQLYGPVGGTPLPPGAQPQGTSPGPPEPLVPPEVAPSSAHTTEPDGPLVAVASYDPQTGRYLDADGLAHTQSDLKVAPVPEDWQDLVLREMG